MNILFAASEVYPLIKTGGLGDVGYSLPHALERLGDDVRVVLPAYRDVIDTVADSTVLGELEVPGGGIRYRAKILQATSEGFDCGIYLVDIPALYDRPGNPYVQSDGVVWPDNSERFIVFCRAVALLTRWLAGRGWKPDVVHSNDWQTGLVPAFLGMLSERPLTVFTIHNLAYDGLYSHAEFQRLGLPADWWSHEYVEFYNGFSMLKGGMVFSDVVTTVSPTYAKEICTPEKGFRMDGILRALDGRLTGILNGIDTTTWDPQVDPHISRTYSSGSDLAEGKLANKHDLLRETRLKDADVPLLGFIGRLVEQKGIDLIIEALPGLLETTNASFIILGTGNLSYEEQLMELEEENPERVHVHIGYSEKLAHRIEAGCDIFLMPSRFEPCGLNQMYSLRYGTLPIVNHTGGLVDTVVDVSLVTLKDQTATGFVMQHADVDTLRESVENALELRRNEKLWRQVQVTAMGQDFGWESSASAYRQLYQAKAESKA